MKPANSNPHSNALRAHRRKEAGGVFFLTKCLNPRHRVIDDALATVICEAFAFQAREQRCLLGLLW